MELWTIHGQVYDLREWAGHHPGGRWILETTKGSDCTAIFESYHTFAPNVRKQLETYHVRAATPEETDEYKMWEWDRTPKSDEVRKRVREYFVNRDISPKAPWFMLLWHAFWTFMLVYQGYAWYTEGKAQASILFGVSIAYGSADWAHSGLHFSVFKNPRLNVAAGYLFGMLHHVPDCWVRQHVLGHHVFTHVPGKDPDLHHFQERLGHWLGGFRLASSSPTSEIYGSWRLLMPFLSAMTSIFPLLEDAPNFVFKGELRPTIVAPHTGPQLTTTKCLAFLQWMMVLSTILSVAFRFGPLVALTPFLVWGYLFYFFSQVSHANRSSSSLSTVPNASNRKEWAEHQYFVATGDYEHSSRFWLVLSIGLNVHAVHHVFPNIHWWHYLDLYPILQEVFGPKDDHEDYLSSLKGHFCYIAELNDSDSTMVHRKNA